MYLEQIKITLQSRFNTYSKNELALAAMIFGIPFTINLGNALLILGVIFSLFGLRANIKAGGALKKPYFLFFPVFFFLLILLSAFLSKDIRAGFIQVEKNLLFILIPFTLYLLSYNRKTDYSLLFKVFVTANFLATLILISVGVYKVLHGQSSEVMFFHEFGSFLDLHPVYIALNTSISIFYITQNYLNDSITKNSKGMLVVALLCYFYAVLFLCASKAVIIIFILLYLCQLCGVLRKTKTKLYALLGITLLTISFFGVPKVSGRFTEGLHFNITEFKPTEKIENAKVFTNEEKQEISDLELRYLMLKIGLFHLVKENKWLWGYGIGDVQHHLDYHYMVYGLAPGWFEGYNLHNQYAQYLVSYGLLGTVFFLVYLVYSVNIALRTKSRIYLLYLVLIIFVFLFESLLSRNKGIVIFLFFNTLFIIRSLNENRFIRN